MSAKRKTDPEIENVRQEHDQLKRVYAAVKTELQQTSDRIDRALERLNRKSEQTRKSPVRLVKVRP